MLAFDERGAPTWQKGIEKSAIDAYSTYWPFLTPAFRVDGGALDLIYRQERVIFRRRYDLSNGGSLLPDGAEAIVGYFEPDGEYTRSFVWIGSESVTFVIESAGDNEILTIDYSSPADSVGKAVERR